MEPKSFLQAAPPCADYLDDAQFKRASTKIMALAERLEDEQVLCLADGLHDLLRQRRRLRARVSERLEQKICDGPGSRFPN
ncbi:MULTISPECIES: hypothetical protein [unclassified Brevundimonas]|uniref:hypothetical protein n=1 Tax=unclassified Brevundimonas TaxID=2622653 RepID=UPI001FD7901A|nr:MULTISPECIES: hypothetical protein [unclassified Brevundimonas]